MDRCGQDEVSEMIAACDEVDDAGVLAARAAVVPAALARRLAGVFKGLSDPSRLRIISILAQHEMCVNDLAAALGMSQSAVSHQLSDMREMRLVRYRKDGRHVFYALDDEHVQGLFVQGLAHIGHE